MYPPARGGCIRSPARGGNTKNITVAFGIVGLYLAREKGYTGRQVQLGHRKISGVKKGWPRLEPPEKPGSIWVLDVLQVPVGPDRDAMIRGWMAEVWRSWTDRQPWVRKTMEPLLRQDRTGRRV